MTGKYQGATVPGWLSPSIVVGTLIDGSGVTGVIVQELVPESKFGSDVGMSKSMVLGPEVALESRIAWRSEPAPESAVFVTRYVLEIVTIESAENSDVLPAGSVAVALK